MHAALIFKKVCWLSSFQKVMIDYKPRPKFQDETWNPVKFTWFHVALQTKTWTRFLASVAKVHELLWRTLTAFHTDIIQFSHWLGPSFTRYRGHLAFQVESGKKTNLIFTWILPFIEGIWIEFKMQDESLWIKMWMSWEVHVNVRMRAYWIACLFSDS